MQLLNILSLSFSFCRRVPASVAYKLGAIFIESGFNAVDFSHVCCFFIVGLIPELSGTSKCEIGYVHVAWQMNFYFWESFSFYNVFLH